MTRGEIIIATNLHSKVTFLPASFDKRFSRDLYYLAKADPEKELTEKQRAYLFKLLHKYRKQLPETMQQYQNIKSGDNSPKLF